MDLGAYMYAHRGPGVVPWGTGGSDLMPVEYCISAEDLSCSTYHAQSFATLLCMHAATPQRHQDHEQT